MQDCSELILKRKFFLDTQVYHRNKKPTNCTEGTQVDFVFGNGPKVMRTYDDAFGNNCKKLGITTLF